VHFVTKVCEHFWNRRKILDFLYLYWKKEKNFDPYLVDFLRFGDQKCHFRNEQLNIQKNIFNKLILDFCPGSKSTWKRSQGKNRLPLLHSLLRGGRNYDCVSKSNLRMWGVQSWLNNSNKKLLGRVGLKNKYSLKF
jgi:hypothetical protein